MLLSCELQATHTRTHLGTGCIDDSNPRVKLAVARVERDVRVGRRQVEGIVVLAPRVPDRVNARPRVSHDEGSTRNRSLESNPNSRSAADDRGVLAVYLSARVSKV